MVVVVDDEDIENEGYLIMAESSVTAEAMAFFVKHGTRIDCVSMKDEDLERLQLPLMVTHNEEGCLDVKFGSEYVILNNETEIVCSLCKVETRSLTPKDKRGFKGFSSLFALIEANIMGDREIEQGVSGSFKPAGHRLVQQVSGVTKVGDGRSNWHNLCYAEAMAFFVKHGTRIDCVSMKDEDLERLKHPLMVTHNEE
ncbi:bifunctional riboflavin biosynthesis protein RIBA 1, chloroplastic-like protein [Tanacetum coccineum]|uniref:Bifunctional riboflavin biosynthesis protein RIBA 1, chloroplastic-like protein n=1 Tax=Tanacetum coccineum TaxID=301880 RepID=A0ABQ5FLR4_9ASTR